MGMSEAEMAEAASFGGLCCRWYASGKTIADENSAVDPLLIIYKGRAKRETWANDRRYSLTEVAEAPATLQADRLFGLSPHYVSTFRSYGGCAVLEVPKASVYQFMERFEVFRLNLLNMLSSELQRRGRLIMKPRGGDVATRICRFVEQISSSPVGMKDIGITMNCLAQELSTTRLNVSDALHALEERNLVKVKRGHLLVPSMQLLLKSGF